VINTYIIYTSLGREIGGLNVYKEDKYQ